jgi:hypothetical protein
MPGATASTATVPASVPASVTFPKPVHLDLSRALDSAVSKVITGQGRADVTATLRGAEVAIAYKPKGWLTLGGYAARLWSGGWDGGVRATATWGGK